CTPTRSRSPAAPPRCSGTSSARRCWGCRGEARPIARRRRCLMDLVPSAEQDEIVAAAAGLLAEEVPAARLRELRDAPSSRDAALWARCAQQGWFGLGLPAELGGVGYGLVEEALLFRELGRRLVPGPVLATTLAARLAALGGRADLAAALLAGEATA